jgi:hypothetical protein
VLAHKGNPGLGDKIELKKSSWIDSFTGKFLTADNDATWAVKKDGGEFDAFTGATITPGRGQGGEKPAEAATGAPRTAARCPLLCHP